MGCSGSEKENLERKSINVRQINLLNDNYIVAIKFNLGEEGEFSLDTISSAYLGNIFLFGAIQNEKSQKFNDLSKLNFLYNDKDITNYFLNNAQVLNLDSKEIEIFVKHKN